MNSRPGFRQSANVCGWWPDSQGVDPGVTRPHRPV